MLCKKKLWHARGGRGRQIFDILLTYSNELVYLQLITVLVYRSSPPES